MDLPSVQAIGYAILGGILPPLIWLYFLLREDKRCPEPPLILFIALMAGMLAVILVIGPEGFIQKYAIANFASCSMGTCFPIILGWATIEETAKYACCALFVLWRRDVDEPLDLVVYMLTTALGFAALENTLFLVAPFAQGAWQQGLLTDDLRFMGSTLVHVMSSSVIGFALAFTYRKVSTVGGYALRATVVAFALILAIALHTAFNLLIISNSGGSTVSALFVVWTAAVVFFALFEILKYFRYRNLPTNTC